MRSPRELFGIAQVVRRQTTNSDMLTICDALIARLTKEMADRAGGIIENTLAGFVEKPTKTVVPTAVYIDPFQDKVGKSVRADRSGAAMQAAVARAEAGRKPAKGKAKRALKRAAKRGVGDHGKR